MRYIKEPSRDFIFHSVFGCVLNVSVVRAFARLFISMIRFFVLRRRRLLRLIFCLYLLWSIILGVFIEFVLKNWIYVEEWPVVQVGKITHPLGLGSQNEHLDKCSAQCTSHPKQTQR